MVDRPLVSVITGTIPSRRMLLVDAMRNLRDQTYRNLEHCIAVEGNPSEAELAAVQVSADAAVWGLGHRTRVTPLGRHWSSFLAASTSTVPFQVAQWMARGDCLMWWADDERALVPDHIEALVDLLEATGSDFVYPYVRMVPGPGIDMAPHVIGSDPPELGQVTHCLFRAELLDYRGFTTHVGSATDWDQVSYWMAAGARWAMLPRVTFEHRLDKIGEGPAFRAERQPLRGHRERALA
jgi:hypothetical protein